jgi:hypothetical protein
MTLPIVIRPMREHERAMVLSDWKRDLAKPHGRVWGKGLTTKEFWAIVDHVIERVTLPSSEVWVGCHQDDPSTPCCWAATRLSVPGLVVLHAFVRRSMEREDPELAKAIKSEFFYRLVLQHRTELVHGTFNPILELKRE